MTIAYAIGINPQTNHLVQKMNEEQVTSLMEIDNNYILSYINRHDDLEEKKEKCKKLFIEKYGKEKFYKIEKYIDFVFETKKTYQAKEYSSDNRDPLDILKLLFNDQILDDKNEQYLSEYFKNLKSYYFGREHGFTEELEPQRESFRKLICNAYGENAVDILNTRKELDVFSVPSIEVFSKEIMDNFSMEIVHDLISYDIDNFSTLLYIAKNPSELRLFKEYYNVLANVMGKNIVTIQKAISEFYYNRELLEKAVDVELTEEQKSNLIACLCSNKNEFDICSIEDLNNYDNIANSKFDDKLQEIETANDLRNLIFQDILGIDDINEFLKMIARVGISEDVPDLSEDESKMLRCIQFIYYENDISKLKDLANELKLKTGIRNPILLYKTMNKMREYVIEKFKEKILSRDTLERVLQSEEHKSPIKKELIDGVEVYYITHSFLKENGLVAIGHSIYNASGRDIMEYEGPGAMSTISTTLDIKLDPNHLYFSDIASEDFILTASKDADVHHFAKMVKSDGTRNIETALTNLINVDNLNEYVTENFNNSLNNGIGYNETAFYRRRRNHDKRSELRPDGRIKESFKLIKKGENIPIEYAKKYRIPIVVLCDRIIENEVNTENER